MTRAALNVRPLEGEDPLSESRIENSLSSLTRVRATQEDIDRDLGIGSRAALGRQRFLSRDGSFNVRREGLSPLRSLSMYHAMLTMSWTRFFAVMVSTYFAVNILFAFGYIACGEGALAGVTDPSFWGRAQACFFFSVHTVATIGYGSISPVNLSRQPPGHGGGPGGPGRVRPGHGPPLLAVLAARGPRGVQRPGRDRPLPRRAPALMFRVVNERTSQLLEVQATVNLGRNEGGPARSSAASTISASSGSGCIFFPLHWVIVHPIDERSPFYGVSEEAFRDTPRPRSSCSCPGSTRPSPRPSMPARPTGPHEVVWGARFKDMFVPSADGVATIDVRKLHDIEKIG